MSEYCHLDNKQYKLWHFKMLLWLERKSDNNKKIWKESQFTHLVVDVPSLQKKNTWMSR